MRAARALTILALAGHQAGCAHESFGRLLSSAVEILTVGLVEDADGSQKRADAEKRLQAERALAARERAAVSEAQARRLLEERDARWQAVDEELRRELLLDLQRPAGLRSQALVALFEPPPSPLLSESDSRALGGQLRSELAQQSSLRLVPREHVERALRDAKRDSVAVCVGEGCSIEIGKALAADAVVTPVLIQADETCVLGLMAYDLDSETAVWATAKKTTCEPPAILAATGALGKDLAAALSPPTLALEGSGTTPPSQSTLGSGSAPHRRTEPAGK